MSDFEVELVFGNKTLPNGQNIRFVQARAIYLNDILCTSTEERLVDQNSSGVDLAPVNTDAWACGYVLEQLGATLMKRENYVDRVNAISQAPQLVKDAAAISREKRKLAEQTKPSHLSLFATKVSQFLCTNHLQCDKDRLVVEGLKEITRGGYAPSWAKEILRLYEH